MAELRQVELGGSGIETSVIGYGTYHLLDKLDTFTAIESLGAAYDAGVTLFDTSDNYGTENAIGRAIAEGILRRDKIVIASKTGLATSTTEVAAWRGDKSVDASPERIRQQVEKSLWLLGNDGPIDLYQIHLHDPRVPAVDTAIVMNELMGEGKIDAYGVANYDAGALDELLVVCSVNGLTPPATFQPFYNVLTSFGHEAAIDLAWINGMTVLAHSPLHKGALTDSTVNMLSDTLDSSENIAEEQRKFLTYGTDNLKRLREYANASGYTLSQLGIAWLAMQNNTAVLTACTTPQYLEEAIQASEWQIDAEGQEIINSVRQDLTTELFASRLLSVMKAMKLYYH